jgi:pSer/pThr/pTyr-binding forkhead associated (FHA) protein
VLEIRLDVMVMSGVDDGSVYKYDMNADGRRAGEKWTLTIGRRDDNDICLRNDTYISRQHGKLHLQDGVWWLEDCDSTNGSFVENADNAFEDKRIYGTVQLDHTRLFRVGRTWLRIQLSE